jgi:ribosomal protein S6
MTEKQDILAERAEREYELSFLLMVPETASHLTEMIKKHGGEITHLGPVVSIRLAYPIRKQATAFFGFCHFIAPHTAAKEITSGLKGEANVLRILLVTPPPKTEERSSRPLRREEPKSAPTSSILTNEALEQKLEEILK